ncbi:unnamed protein product [Symbiodinium necroappetens]|uniref:Uncharacterized protein n=1 Tax=Symbiodinium necroappetens TaxID=1628268 RepID=A0A812YAW3_9DINO|nr:unnamed protein product [Symbiodinium necroappetens]
MPSSRQNSVATFSLVQQATRAAGIRFTPLRAVAENRSKYRRRTAEIPRASTLSPAATFSKAIAVTRLCRPRAQP